MKFVVHPAVDADRLESLWRSVPGAEWVNARDASEAVAAIPGADAFLGKITPEILERADRLQWVQAFTASLEHYMFRELVVHDCVLSNMRGLFASTGALPGRLIPSASQTMCIELAVPIPAQTPGPPIA